MSFDKPGFRHPRQAKNKAGYTRSDYEGGISTLCAGCGHDSTTNAIIQACFELGVEPHRVAKHSYRSKYGQQGFALYWYIR